MISMTTLDYIEQKYRTATLTELCDMLHLPMHVLSKMIKKTTGFNFKELLQRKRLSKAVELMKFTAENFDCEVVNRIALRDKKTGRVWT